MTVQFIEIAGQKMVILPEAEYRSLTDQAEERSDIEAAEKAEARRLDGEEYVPASLVERLVDGEAGLLVWREYRGLSQQGLGEKVGLSKMTISSLERGKRDTSAKNWRALADALSVDVDDIMPFD